MPEASSTSPTQALGALADEPENLLHEHARVGIEEIRLETVNEDPRRGG